MALLSVLRLVRWRFWVVLPLLGTWSSFPTGIRSILLWWLWLVLLSGLSPLFWYLFAEGKAVASDAQSKLAHATDFTTIEQQFLTLWNALQDAGQGALAFDLLFAGLNLEHFVSTLAHDPAQRSAEEQTIRDQLNGVFQAKVAQANAVLAGIVVSKSSASGG